MSPEIFMWQFPQCCHNLTKFHVKIWFFHPQITRLWGSCHIGNDKFSWDLTGRIRIYTARFGRSVWYSHVIWPDFPDYEAVCILDLFYFFIHKVHELCFILLFYYLKSFIKSGSKLKIKSIKNKVNYPRDLAKSCPNSWDHMRTCLFQYGCPCALFIFILFEMVYYKVCEYQLSHGPDPCIRNSAS